MHAPTGDPACPARPPPPFPPPARPPPTASPPPPRPPLAHCLAPPGPPAADHSDSVRFLLPLSDVWARDRVGRTCLHHAAEVGADGSIAAVLEYWQQQAPGGQR